MTTPTFEALQVKLNSAAEYAQSDAASEVFDHWFELATQFAQGQMNVLEIQRHTLHALEIMLTTYSIQRIRDPSTDLYAVRELFRHAQAIFEIHRTKPKFAPLLEPSSEQVLGPWLRSTGVRSLEAVAYAEVLHGGVRVDAFSTMQALLELWEFLSDNSTNAWAHVYATTWNLHFELNHVAHTTASVSTDAIVRDAALQTIQQIARFDKTYAPVIALSRVARDILALSPLWSMGVLASSVAMDQLLVKMVATSTDHAGTKSLFCTSVMESLYEALMNNRSSREWAFDAKAYEYNLCHLFRACYQTYKMHPNEGHRVVLPDSYLHAIESVLLHYPDCVSLVQFALDADDYCMFVMISRISHAFQEGVWTDQILPFARAQLALLPLQGVSGLQRDQELVNMIREACRLYYLNIDRVPSANLGRHVFLTVTQAIRHGYIETERFTEILALILHRHYSMGHVQVYQWIPTLFLPEVSHNHKTSRALGESLLIALGIHPLNKHDADEKVPLGLQNSSFGLENAIMSAETSKAISEAFSVILAKFRSGPADMFWQEVCLNFGPFIQEHRTALSALLHSITIELETCQTRGSIAVDRLDSLTELLHGISMRIDSADASTVFRLSLQVISLGAGASTAAIFEDTLVNAIEHMSEKDSLDLITTELALSICGPRTRTALAKLVPHMCLEDIDPHVRQAALRCIVSHPDLIRTHSVVVIRSLYWIHNPMMKAQDTSDKMCVDQLALATDACPVLVILASVAPIYVKECIVKLLSAANLNAVNDALNEANIIAPHLDTLVATVPRNALLSFVLTTSGMLLLPILTHLSSKWQQLSQEVIQSGFLIERDELAVFTGQFPSLERLARSKHAYKRTEEGKNTLEQILGADDMTLVQSVPSRNQLHQLIVNELDHGAYMKAIRLANTMRAWYPDDYIQMGTHELVTETLLPLVADHDFPRIYLGSYTSATLDAFPAYYRTMHEVKLLFPTESEEVLHMSKHLEAFCLAKLQEILMHSGPDQAKEWMDFYGFHVPIVSSMAPAKNVVVTVPLSPSAPPWAETMLHVLDGELPAVALDSIAVDNV
ncbi:hypothetical protein AC1031_001530 [Aphanomyces cochlioides]|nr:hypothetical protein AC1031_001530 [Aphanomyces cochlioides]